MKIFKGTIFGVIAMLALLQGSVLGQTYDCSELLAIDDIDMFLLGSNLVVVWQEPRNMEYCGFSDVSHTLTYSGHNSEQTVTTNDYYVYFDYYPYMCVPSVITITAFTEALTSDSTTVEYYTETAAVENLSIEIEDGALVATWTDPEDSEECDFVYTISFSDELQQVATETTNQSVVLDVSVVSCVQSTLTVTPVNKGYVGIASSTTYEGQINPVRNYLLSSAEGEVVAVFDPPTEIEYCDLTYEVREQPADCFTKTVDVAAYNGRIYSEWVSEQIEVQIGAVSDLSATVNGDYIDVTWSEPSGASACSVTYQLKYDSSTFNTAVTSATLESSILTACAATSITVSAVSDTGTLGVSSAVELTGELGVVQDLALNAADTSVTASWSAPVNSDACEPSYLVEYQNESGSHIYVTSATSITFDYNSCDVDVTLIVEAHGTDGSVGESSSVTLAATC